MATVKLTVEDLLLHLLRISCPTRCGDGPPTCRPKSVCEGRSCKNGTHIPSSCDIKSNEFCGPCNEDSELAALRMLMRAKLALTLPKAPGGKTKKKTVKKAAKKRGGKKR